MIVARIWWNTDAEGNWVEQGDLEPDGFDTPQTIYGPFESITKAVDWMTHDYPDDDMDVYDLIAEDFDVPPDWYVTDPSFIRKGENVGPPVSRTAREIQAS